MRRTPLLLPIALLLAACGALPSAAPTPTFTPPPTPPIIASPIPVSNAAGTPVAAQPGFIEWVLLSGVDEHGLLVEHTLILLDAPDPAAGPGPQVHTGSPVKVLEIRHAGPQNLQRFYRVETLDGLTGWISDYYVRRQAYLFNRDGTSVSIAQSPAGPPAGSVANVTPITLLQPRELVWWQVSTLDGSLSGWVEAAFVKESPEEEYLLGMGHDHACEFCPFFLP